MAACRIVLRSIFPDRRALIFAAFRSRSLYYQIYNVVFHLKVLARRGINPFAVGASRHLTILDQIQKSYRPPIRPPNDRASAFFYSAPDSTPCHTAWLALGSSVAGCAPPAPPRGSDPATRQLGSASPHTGERDSIVSCLGRTILTVPRGGGVSAALFLSGLRSSQTAGKTHKRKDEGSDRANHDLNDTEHWQCEGRGASRGKKHDRECNTGEA
jgi:hypothetical protein